MSKTPPGSDAERRHTTVGRRIGFRLVAVVLVVLVVEGFSFLALRVSGLSAQPGDVSDYLQGALDAAKPAAHRPLQGLGPDYDEVLHPYAGFVLTRSDPARQDLTDLGWQEPVMHQRGPDRVIVAVLGGSVARQVYELAGDVLRQELGQLPRFAGKDVVLVNLSLGGYKQPQQLMILNYLLTLGAEFDVVLNLDGFNEVALHAGDNGAKGVFPIFPRWWQARVLDVVDPEARRLTGELAFHQARLAAFVSSDARRVLGYSQTGTLINALRMRSYHADIAAVVERIQSPENGTATRYVASGPRWKFSKDELYDHLARIWSRASLQLHHLCVGNGIEYYHFLQPNQYVEGSKPMGAEERRRAFRAGTNYRPGVVLGYPRLLAEGRSLVTRGVDFTDLTQLFANETEPRYYDVCCHFLPIGAQEIARQMVAAMETPREKSKAEE